jgi:hypothetical protein
MMKFARVKDRRRSHDAMTRVHMGWYTYFCLCGKTFSSHIEGEARGKWLMHARGAKKD